MKKTIAFVGKKPQLWKESVATYSFVQVNNDIEFHRLPKEAITMVIIEAHIAVSNQYQFLLDLDKPLFDNIPILIYEDDTPYYDILPTYQYGISDIIEKTTSLELIDEKIKHIINVFEVKEKMQAIIKQQKHELQHQLSILKKGNDFVVEVLGNLLHKRNVDFGRHIHSIRFYTRTLLEDLAIYQPEFNLSAIDIELIVNAASLHDIGKMCIPDTILLKPDKLTKEEFDVVKKHTLVGYQLIASACSQDDDAFYKYCLDICRHHHERYDGSGYPDGLKGEDISFCSQVVAIADVYDALTSNRAYKKAYSHDTAIEMILNGECGVFTAMMQSSFSRVAPLFEKRKKELKS